MKIISIVLNICSLFLIIGCNNQGRKPVKIDPLYYDTIYHGLQNEYEVYTMFESKKHGVMRRYDKRYGEFEEQLFIQDKLMITERLGGDSLQAGYTYFYNQNDTMYPIGSLIYDRKSYQKVDIMCTYFEIDAPDTIAYQKPYKIAVKANIGLKKSFEFSLTLGEIDSSYNLISKKGTYMSKYRELEFEISDYKPGINLVTGILTYYENGQDVTKKYRISAISVPLVFYKQFIAIPPN